MRNFARTPQHTLAPFARSSPTTKPTVWPTRAVNDWQRYKLVSEFDYSPGRGEEKNSSKEIQHLRMRTRTSSDHWSLTWRADQKAQINYVWVVNPAASTASAHTHRDKLFHVVKSSSFFTDCKFIWSSQCVYLKERASALDRFSRAQYVCMCGRNVFTRLNSSFLDAFWFKVVWLADLQLIWHVILHTSTRLKSLAAFWHCR